MAVNMETVSTAAVNMEIHVNCGSKHGKKLIKNQKKIKKLIKTGCS